ncbi:unnamed protein product [Cuscuta epithymum]|uniref:Uncharacterized protein n=1 Tax=Cuscuta epithymum TaxID=186058 RepID=A0AAV0GI29_9ASTE|nr:unnamed protein product [Cuscuta epithymum]
MDPKAFAKLSKQLAREKKKDEGLPTQRVVDEFFKKPEGAKSRNGEGPSQATVDEGSKAVELKRKNAGKGSKPPEKKQKKGDAEQDAPVITVEENSSSEAPAQKVGVAWPTEDVNFSVKKGCAIMHGTLDPREFLRGTTPPTDKSVLSRQKTGPLGSKILQAAVTAALGLGELMQRMEQSDLQRAKAAEIQNKLEEDNAALRKQLMEVEAALRLEKDNVQKKVDDARALGRGDGLEAAAATIKAAAEEAEKAKAEAVAKAEREAVAVFLSDGWKAEDQRQWRASVVEASVEDWVGGPGALWLARKGKSFYEGGEFFTQANLYRKLARHFGVEPKEFKPEAYGLPPLQPDVRIPLPSGEERQLLEDSELARCDDDDEGDADGDASSRPKEDVAENA